MSRKRILVVEDNEDNRRILLYRLKKIGDLKSVIPGITGYEFGPYKSPEGLNKGFTHGFVMTFDKPESRDVYLPHPEHEKVKAEALQIIEDVIAFDFEV